MKVLESIYVNKKLQHELSYFNEDKPPCQENYDVIIRKKKRKKHNMNKTCKRTQQPSIAFLISKPCISKKIKAVATRTSMPELNKNTNSAPNRNRSYIGIHEQNAAPFHSKFTINMVSEYDKAVNPFFHSQTKWKIYRCQIGTTEESCCCSCNSDAMFEVMKSLYDCYKKKNCDHCECILCGHKHREERRLGELRKSLGVIEPTVSAKTLKEKVKAAEKLLEGKSTAEKEQILKDLVKSKQPLPAGKTSSEKSLIKKVRTELGLPPPPETAAAKAKMSKAQAAGLITPLEGKTAAEKEKILKAQAAMGIELPKGRTASEMALISKVKTASGIPVGVAPEMVQTAKAPGQITPLKGKTPAQREKVLRGLAMQGIPLPEGKTPSDRKLNDKVRADLGLPPEPKSKSIREKHTQAANIGLLQPLEGKTAAEKEKILQGFYDMGIPLPEGRTASEKALIAKIKAKSGAAEAVPSKQLAKGKGAGVLTPLKGKSPAEKEKILRGLAMSGIPLPEGRTASEKRLIDKVRADLGLPPEPRTPDMRKKHEQAAEAGILQPLEGKSLKEKEVNLRKLQDLGIPLPEGRTASEKALIAKILAELFTDKLAPSEKMRKAKAAGLITPLRGKTPDHKERILRGLAMYGIPLPEGKTASEKKLINKVIADLGLPPEATTPEARAKYEKAANAGKLLPLEGKTRKQKEDILYGLHGMGIPLPEGRTASEKSLIAKFKAKLRAVAPSEKKPGAVAAGLKSPLEGKSPAEIEKLLRDLAMRGVPLPEGRSSSQKKLIEKIRNELGLPPEPTTASMKNKHVKAAEVGLLLPLEGKSPKEKEKILKGLLDMGVPLPEGRTSSEKALISKLKSKGAASITTDKIRKAKAAGLLTPLAGKSAEQRQKVVKGLAKAGLPLPEGKTSSEKSVIRKVKKETGIPDTTPSEKLRKAKAAGLLTPLEGKAPAKREKILRGRAAAGLPLPVGKSPSERALLQKIKDDTGHVTPSPSERLRRAKAAGLVTPLKGKSSTAKEKILKDMLAAGVPIPEGETSSEKELIKKLTAEHPKTPSVKVKPTKAAGVLSPLEGKTPAQKEKILRGLVKARIPLPEGKTPSEKEIINKVRKDMGLPPEPKTPSLREKMRKAQAAGLLTPLEGKSAAQKEKIIKGLVEAGIPLPIGRTASEIALIERILAALNAPKVPSAKLRKAKAAGLMTPLKGKSAAERERILRGLADLGLPLPEARTASDRKIEDKVRAELGLPPEPKTPSMREKHEKASTAGVLVPLEGLSNAGKEKVLKAQLDLGLDLPEGRTPSEKALIAKVKGLGIKETASEKLRKAKSAGLVTPIAGKSAAQKEKIMRGLAEIGLPLPEAKSASDKALAHKVRTDLGLPPEPKTPSMKVKHEKASEAGVLVPLEGLSKADKEKVLKAQASMGLPLPEGRTSSEKEMIAKIRAESKRFAKIPSEKLRKAKAAGLLTPMEGKSKAQKEKLLRALAMLGIPLPEAKTVSDKKLTDKVRAELGVPPEPKTPSMKERHEKASADGVLIPLEGLPPAEKEKVLRAQFDRGMILPEGRTASEKALIAKIKGEKEPAKVPPEKLKKAKAAGLLTPLEGKSAADKEKIIKGLAEAGLPLPEGKTASEKSIIHKVRTQLGIPPPAKTPSEKAVVHKAKAEGLFTPISGKPPAEKEKILKGLAEAGLPMPVGQTASEKAMIKKIRSESGLPAQATASEKMGKIKTKSKKIGVAQGIAGEEYEDIKKTTKCDRGCGCDKKRIRFKHSYVKIRVTSPDISSLCSCPYECLPGVKSGAFIDNDGIKVTVGSAVGIPSYSGEDSYMTSHKIRNATFRGWADNRKAHFNDKKIKTLFDKNNKSPMMRFENLESERDVSEDRDDIFLNTTSSDVSDGSVFQLQYRLPHNVTESEQSYLYCEGWAGEPNEIFKTLRRFKSSGILYPEAVSNDYKITEGSSRSSFESVMIIDSETSLSLTTNSSDSMDTISVMSFADSSVTSNSSHYFGYQLFEDLYSHSSNEEERSISRIDYDTYGTVTSNSNHLLRESAPFTSHLNNFTRKLLEARKQNEYLVFRMSQTQFTNAQKNQYRNKRRNNTAEPIVVINHLDKNRDVKAMVDNLLAKSAFSDASSIFVVVQSDDNEAGNSSDGRNSTICIQMSENPTKWKNKIGDKARRKLSSVSHGVKISAKGKKYLLQELPTAVFSQNPKEPLSISKNQPVEKNNVLKEILAEEKEEKTDFIENVIENIKEKPKDKTTEAREDLNENSKDRTKDKDDTNHKLCQATIPNEKVPVAEHRCEIVSMDTTADRPCCCQIWSQDKYLAAKVMSAQINPLLVKQAIDMEQHGSYISLDLAPSPETHYRVPQSTTRGHGVKKTPQEVCMASTEQAPQKCQCSPEKLREMLELAIKAGRNRNFRSVGVEVKTLTSTQRDNKGDCKACLKNKSPPKEEESCPCLVVGKSKPKIHCPCTVDDPPDSEAEPDLKSGDTGTKSSPCPTGPSGEAANIIPSSGSLDFKWENTESEEVMSEVELERKTNKKEHKCKHHTCPDDRNKKKPHKHHGNKTHEKKTHENKPHECKPHENEHHPDTSPTKDLMQRFGLLGKVGRKRHKQHAVKPDAGQRHGKHHHGAPCQAEQPHPAQPHACQPQAGRTHTDHPHAGTHHANQSPAGQLHENTQDEPPCGPSECKLQSMQPGQPQNVQPHAGQPLAGCPQAPCLQAEQPHAVQPYAVKPHEGQPQCSLPHCGLPHCGLPHCDLAHCLQHPCGQPQWGSPPCGQPHFGQPAFGQPTFGQPQCGPPPCGHPQCGKPYCGIPHCGQPLTCKPPHNVHDSVPKGTPATAQIEAGEAYKQVLNKQARFNKSTVGTTTDPKFLCDCTAATGKKKKKIVCECPPSEPEQPASANNEFNWHNSAEINKMKSVLTETTSGFKMNKKKRPPPEPQKEFNIEDAIRYYATLKPELFRNIVEEQEKIRKLEKKGAKGKKSEVQCVCSAETATTARQSAPSLPSGSDTTRTDENPDEDGPFRGLKIRVGGKGSGSPGLTGICCFDMVQDSFTTW